MQCWSVICLFYTYIHKYIYTYIKKHVLVSNGSWLKGFTLPHYFRNLLEFSVIYNKVTLGSKMENNLPTTVMGVE